MGTVFVENSSLVYSIFYILYIFYICICLLFILYIYLYIIMKIIVMTTIIIVTIVIIVLTIIIINYDACWNKYQITIYLYIYILPYRWEPNYIPIIYMTILVWYFIGILVVLE